MGSKIEREVKLAAGDGFQLPDLDAVVDGVGSAPFPTRKLDATYYDTGDLRLARAGVSLRHRRGDPGPWTVKLPFGAGGPVMARREVSFPGAAGTPPQEAVALVRAYARSAAIVPVARLKTSRSGVALRRGGVELAEVTDDEVAVYQGRRLVSRFREVEVEVADGAPGELLPAVLRALRVAGAGRTEPISKVSRALGPRARAAPDHRPAPLSKRSGVGEVVRAAVATGLTRMVSHDPGVRMGDDPEDTHQARVGTRRLRSDLRTFGPLLDAAWVAGLRAEAGWYAGLLGVVRDAEVLTERLQRQSELLDEGDRAAARRVLALLRSEREAGRATLVEAMGGDRYAGLLDRLAAACTDPAFVADPQARAARALPALVERPWRRLRRGVAALGPEPADAELHAVRILAKHTRYAAEAAAPVIGPEAAAFARAVAALQGVLGDHQDACVTETWLRGRAKSLRGPGVAMVVGQLVGLQRAEAARHRAAWRSVWQRADDKRLRRWLSRP